MFFIVVSFLIFWEVEFAAIAAQILISHLSAKTCQVVCCFLTLRKMAIAEVRT